MPTTIPSLQNKLIIKALSENGGEIHVDENAPIVVGEEIPALEKAGILKAGHDGYNGAHIHIELTDKGRKLAGLERNPWWLRDRFIPVTRCLQITAIILAFLGVIQIVESVAPKYAQEQWRSLPPRPLD